MRNESPADESPHPPPGFPTVTQFGTPLESWYGREALEEIKPKAGIGGPGRLPFAGEIRQDMYRERLWVMGYYSGYTNPREMNARIKPLLAQGQKAFSVTLDLPTQSGLSVGEITSVLRDEWRTYR